MHIREFVMTREKEDRRIKITKRAIKESFVELMQEHPISKVSVKMICERADINRSTFYSHYSDQYDLLRQVQKEVVEGIKDAIADRRFTVETEETIPILVRILEYARENTGLFKVLLSEEGDTSLQEEVMLIAQDKTFDEVRVRDRLDRRLAMYLELFSITGCISIIKKWIDDGTPDEPKMVAELITKLLFQGLSAYY